MRMRSVVMGGLICSLMLGGSAGADSLCIKSAFKGGSKVAMKSKVVATGTKCPSGYYKMVDTSTFVGPQGPQGAQGTDGRMRIYGDGSAGAKVISADTTLGDDDKNLQFTDITINAGTTLTVPSGTVLRCTGTFTNNGTITVRTGASGGLGAFNSGAFVTAYDYRDGPAHPGVSPGAAGNGPQARYDAAIANSGSADGGAPGRSISILQARQLLNPGLFGGGGGGSAGYGLALLSGSNSGGAGGGSFVVLCEGGIVNNGTITANGATASGGGGAGGFIVLASKTSVFLDTASVIQAKGADGQNAGIDAGPSGGGGGGIVHFVAPVVTAVIPVPNPDVSGGVAGTTSANVVTSSTRYGGGGGGGCGGNGGRGGRVSGTNPADTGNATAGGTGLAITTEIDPTSLF